MSKETIKERSTSKKLDKAILSLSKEEIEALRRIIHAVGSE